MQKHLRNLLIIAILYFLWGFITSFNDILTPHLKRACELNNFQSGFVQFAFFGAYFLMSMPAAFILRKIGYHKSLVTGLVIATCGALLILPASWNREYIMFLIGLAVVASGITLLQVAANPYVSLLGDPAKAASRISLMGGLNSLGATLAPRIGGLMILAEVTKTDEEIAALPPAEKAAFLDQQAQLTELPYIGVAVMLAFCALFIYFARLPEVQVTDKENRMKKLNIFSYPKLWSGILAIFFYVGAEVGIANYLIGLGKSLNVPGYSELIGAGFVTAYWGSMLVFRLVGIPLLNRVNPLKALFWMGLIAILLLIPTITSSAYFDMNILGKAMTIPLGMLTAVMVGCCNAMMWPIIFPKAIEGLGIHTARGSSYLIMAVVGGALLPLLMGYISDVSSMKIAYVVPLVCYVFIAWYGYRFRKPEAV